MSQFAFKTLMFLVILAASFGAPFLMETTISGSQSWGITIAFLVGAGSYVVFLFSLKVIHLAPSGIGLAFLIALCMLDLAFRGHHILKIQEVHAILVGLVIAFLVIVAHVIVVELWGYLCEE